MQGRAGGRAEAAQGQRVQVAGVGCSSENILVFPLRPHGLVSHKSHDAGTQCHDLYNNHIHNDRIISIDPITSYGNSPNVVTAMIV